MQENSNKIQAEYYKKTALHYDKAHLSSGIDEHTFALYFLSSMIKYHDIKSILDVGAGTGRAITFLKETHPEVNIIGIEPVQELREQGYSKGISTSSLRDGDGNHLEFQNGEFDLVCEFGVLHHVSKPDQVISEMLRVGSRFIFISDSNNFGQGSGFSRAIKQLLDFLGLWKFADLIKTKGKGYHISEGDGLFYSYSVFNNYKQIRNQCRKIHMLNTDDAGINLYKSAPHIVLFGEKYHETFYTH